MPLPELSNRPVARRRTALAGSLLLALALTVVAAVPAGAASLKRVDLGGANLERLSPNCGMDFSRDCVAEGKVTIFQAKSRGIAGRTMVAPFSGKLVAWSISLADVTTRPVTVGGQEHGAQKPFFDGVFGTPASARIAVLRRVEKNAKGAPKYRLVRQGPIQILNPFFGTAVTFTLEKPLNVLEDQVVALSVPTWAPALWKPRACNAVYDSMLDPEKCRTLLGQYGARTSRIPRGTDKCTLRQDSKTQEPNEALAKSRAQQQIDSDRRYGCYYGPQVMLYSATIVGK